MSNKDAIKEFVASQEGLDKLKELARDGKTLDQIAREFDITRNTLYRWSKANADIQSALTEGKKSADERVENSLYEQCFDRPTKEETIEYDDTGRIVKRITKTKVIPASVNAIQYWLANRSEGKWKARQQLELTGNPSAPVVFIQDIPNPFENQQVDKRPTDSSNDDAQTKEHDGHQPTDEQ